MQSYIINLNNIEELQMIKDEAELQRILLRAKSTIVQGETVILQRTNPDGSNNTVDELTTEKDLEQYREKVLKFL